MSVPWTQTAADQLQAIRDYLARSSPGYAQAVAGRIIAQTQALAGQPLLGAEVPEYGDPAIREVFEHPVPHPVPGGRGGRAGDRRHPLVPPPAADPALTVATG